MGGHISQKWYEFVTGDREIDRYGWLYRLVIENVDRCGWDYRLVIENDHRYGRDYRLLIENNGDRRYGPKTIEYQDWRLLWSRKKIGVWKRLYRDWWSRTSTAMIENEKAW